MKKEENKLEKDGVETEPIVKSPIPWGLLIFLGIVLVLMVFCIIMILTHPATV